MPQPQRWAVPPARRSTARSSRAAAARGSLPPTPSPACSCAAPRSLPFGWASTRSGSLWRRSARRSAPTRLVLLPGVQLGASAVLPRVHGALVVAVPGGELDHVAVRVAEVDGMDEAVVGDAPRLDARRLALLQHPLQIFFFDFQSDVQIVVVLLLERERPVGRLEEREARAVVHAVEAVQHIGAPAALGLVDAEGVGERQAEEILVEAARLLGIPATIGVVMETFDHCSVSNCWSFTIPAKPENTSFTLDQLFSFFMLPS